ncbi:MAG: 50S ribosomal protein L4 [Candidatus Omnitrophica bacterium]|nr:50S ribosomal protein L4 [Candidatus Omnitrophota bacterium]
MKSVAIVDLKGKNVGKFALDEDFFQEKANKTLLYQASLMYLANTRKASAHTKTRSQVRGGGKKPWRQKGTGRARVGTIRSPLWRGGGVVFGPGGRKFNFSLPKKVRNLALIHSLNAKIKDNQLVVVDKISLSEPKTKEFATFLKAVKANNKPLVVTEKLDARLNKAARNIGGLMIKPFNYINAYDVLKHDKVVFSKLALENLIKLRKR